MVAAKGLFCCKWPILLQRVAENGHCKWFCCKWPILLQMILLQMSYFCCKLPILLQMILLQMSYFCCKCPILLLMTSCKWPAAKTGAANGKKVAANGLAANGFAANDLHLGGPQKPAWCKWICCKWPDTVHITARWWSNECKSSYRFKELLDPSSVIWELEIIYVNLIFIEKKCIIHVVEYYSFFFRWESNSRKLYQASIYYSIYS